MRGRSGRKYEGYVETEELERVKLFSLKGETRRKRKMSDDMKKICKG
jgi:DNA polymerase/3'-5' exonuclease PolX